MGPQNGAITAGKVTKTKQNKAKQHFFLLYHLQILAKTPPSPPPQPSVNLIPPTCPSFEIIISMPKPYMYPIVILFGEQKWQIGCKSSQVDYTLIPEADA